MYYASPFPEQPSAQSTVFYLPNTSFTSRVPPFPSFPLSLHGDKNRNLAAAAAAAPVRFQHHPVSSLEQKLLNCSGEALAYHHRPDYGSHVIASYLFQRGPDDDLVAAGEVS